MRRLGLMRLVLPVLLLLAACSLPADPSPLPPAAALENVRGGVREHLPDRSYGHALADVRIVFEREDGSLTREARSGSNGRYGIQLPAGRYSMTASLDGYQPYSTGAGFVVVSDGGGPITANIFLPTLAGFPCPPSGRFPGHSVRPFAGQRDQPPDVRIAVEPATIPLGHEALVTVWGDDDSGLTSVWWFAEGSDEPALGRAHLADCQRATACSRGWTIAPTRPGRLLLLANARDIAYPNGESHQASEGHGMACAYLTVTP